jgi:hypothetical protein
MTAASAPEHLTGAHDIVDFASGVEELDVWLKRRTLANELSHASRTFVITSAGRVIGYYALATGAVARAVATGRVRRCQAGASFTTRRYARHGPTSAA